MVHWPQENDLLFLEDLQISIGVIVAMKQFPIQILNTSKELRLHLRRHCKRWGRAEDSVHFICTRPFSAVEFARTILQHVMRGPICAQVVIDVAEHNP